MGKKAKRREKARLKALGGQTAEQEVAPEASEDIPEKKAAGAKGFKGIYEQHYKRLLIIPLVILLLAFGQIIFQIATTGDFVQKATSIQGGQTITIFTDKAFTASLIEEDLGSAFPDATFGVRELTSAGQVVGLIVDGDLDGDSTQAILDVVRKHIGDVTEEDYSVNVIGSSLGESFFRETILAILIAFFFMGFVVFLYFRTIIPSAAAILAAFSDLIVTLAIINVIDVKLSTGGIAAFLMLIGYSIDTDILLSTRVLKRQEGTIMDAVHSSIKTGLTMTFTTIAAVTVALIVAKSDVLKQIMLILLIGLIVDLVFTWIQNVGMLRWHLERKKRE